ncbi:SIMPL domain-containing protein [Compostibacter hankyongensis]|uniref:SIMPL domain-containing protein n=1 Tax=Compostibacter hankyongensis TaxID=1007089 RepID=A0ABP8GA09_9BACT
MRNAVTALILGIALIIAAALLGSAYKYKYRSAQIVSVTGGAEVNFTSDLIVWTGSYSKKSMVLKEAYAQLKEDENKVRDYLTKQGINPKELVFSAVNIRKEFSNRYDENGRITGNEFTGYALTQTVKVQSKEIGKVEQVSRQVTELIQAGVEFNSAEPSYYYTKLADLKIDLLAKASADGRVRAETIAKNAGSKLGGLKSADMGIFQITGQYSNEEYTWGGTLNTSSREKTASITVKMEFALR